MDNLLEKNINPSQLLIKRHLPDLQDAREMLIDNLRNNFHFDEKVLAAMAAVPRHAFAPPLLWRMAYSDVELWGPGAFLPRPSVVAKIAQVIVENGSKKVLEYATGTGYITAVLSLLAEQVDTVEHDPWQLWLSSDAFRELEINNIRQKASDGKLGWPEHAPYDAITVSAAIPRMLKEFTAQLREGGVMIAPIGSYYGPHQLTHLTTTPDDSQTTELGVCFFPPLTGVWHVAITGEHTEADAAPSFWRPPQFVMPGIPAAGVEGYEPFPGFEFPGWNIYF